MRRLKRAERSRVENLKRDAEAGRKARPADVLFLVGLVEGGREVVPEVGREESFGFGAGRKVLITRPDGSQMLESVGQGKPHREAPREFKAFDRSEENPEDRVEAGRRVLVVEGDEIGKGGRVDYIDRGANRVGFVCRGEGLVVPLDQVRVVRPNEEDDPS